MKSLTLTQSERWILHSAFLMQPPRQGGGVGVEDLRKTIRVYDALEIDEVAEKKELPTIPDKKEHSKTYSLEDQDFDHLKAMFKSAKGWNQAARVARRVLAIADKIEHATGATPKKKR